MGLLDSILGQMGGQPANTSGAGGGASALLPALMAIMAAKSGGGAGGLGALGGMLGGAGNAAPTGGGGIGGMLSGLMGGGAQGGSSGGLGGMLGGSGVAGGLGGLLQAFEQNGHGATAQSWGGGGANAAVSPDQVGQALGPDTIDQLAGHTGMSPGDVMSHLSQVLPQAVHQLTPNGRLPTSDEASQWV